MRRTCKKKLLWKDTRFGCSKQVRQGKKMRLCSKKRTRMGLKFVKKYTDRMTKKARAGYPEKMSLSSSSCCFKETGNFCSECGRKLSSNNLHQMESACKLLNRTWEAYFSQSIRNLSTDTCNPTISSVAFIGGGICGLLYALILKWYNPGIEVEVIEKRKEESSQLTHFLGSLISDSMWRPVISSFPQFQPVFDTFKQSVTFPSYDKIREQLLRMCISRGVSIRYDKINNCTHMNDDYNIIFHTSGVHGMCQCNDLMIPVQFANSSQAKFKDIQVHNMWLCKDFNFYGIGRFTPWQKSNQSITKRKNTSRKSTTWFSYDFQIAKQFPAYNYFDTLHILAGSQLINSSWSHGYTIPLATYVFLHFLFQLGLITNFTPTCSNFDLGSDDSNNLIYKVMEEAHMNTPTNTITFDTTSPRDYTTGTLLSTIVGDTRELNGIVTTVDENKIYLKPTDNTF